MKNNMENETSLGEGRKNVLPYITRSQKLAKDLMKTLGMKHSTIDSFELGKILITNCKNPLSIKIEELSERDKAIILNLDKNGLIVYHVLESNLMVGKQIEILCEHEVSTFEKVTSTKSYLYVPKDIFAEAISVDDTLTSESNRESVIKDYIEHEIFMAFQDYLCAYVENADGSVGFYNIGVNVINGNLFRTS